MLLNISPLLQRAKNRLFFIPIILLTLFFSSLSNGLIAQAQEFDPDGLLTVKLKVVEKAAANDDISLTIDEKIYINENLDAIRARKKVIKRSLKKAQALNQTDEALDLQKQLEQLTLLTTKYYSILYKTNKEN